jgi:MFS family permease
VLVLAYGLMWAGDGAGGVPWTAIVGRVIPVEGRGRFFALTQVIGGLGRIGAGALVGLVFAGRVVEPFPTGGALLVLGAALLLGLSTLALAKIREPAPEAPEASLRRGDSAPNVPDAPLSFRAYMRTLPARLRARPDIGWLALTQALAGALAAVGPFYLRLAETSLGAARLPGGIEGRFLIAATIGALALAPVWGWVTDRFGPRAALAWLVVAGLLSPLVALVGTVLATASGATAGAAPLLWAFYAAYFCLGGVSEGGWVVFTNYLLEAVPDGDERPTYIGLLSALAVPGAVLLPLGAGLLVRLSGPGPLLVVAAFLLLAALLVARTLPDTRRA